MTAAVATRPAASPPTAARVHPDRAIGRHAFGLVWRRALAVALTFGAVAASSALAYASTYPTAASRLALAASFKGDGGFSVLFGQVDGIGSIGGYTTYKSYVTLTTIGAIWAVLTTTRLLRGEEDAGRWQLLLAGRTDAVRATRATLAGIGVAIALVFVISTLLVLGATRKPSLGIDPTDAVLFGLAMSVPLCTFAAVAAVTAQLARTRRLASSIAMGVFAVAFVLRMVADSGTSTHWLLWTTPLGWAELVKPMTDNDLWPLGLALLATVALTSTALLLAGRRDTGDGTFSTAESTPVRPFGLGSTRGLTLRLGAGGLLGWTVGIVALSFVMGLVTKAAVESLDASSSAGDTLARFGATGRGADPYLAAVFLLVGAVVALLPAGQVTAAREEEASGRLAYVLAGPTRRVTWLTGRLLLAAGAVVAAGLLAGATTWVGALAQGVDVRFASAVAAGLNVVPAALLSLAVGAAALAVAPRFAPSAVYLLVGWSLVVDLIGSLVTGLEPLTRLSVFHYVSLVPAEDPDWTALAVMTALAAVIAAGAGAVFDRRDLHLG